MEIQAKTKARAMDGVLVSTTHRG